MLIELKLPQLRHFENPEDLIQRAYDTQSERIAYVRDDEKQEFEAAVHDEPATSGSAKSLSAEPTEELEEPEASREPEPEPLPGRGPEQNRPQPGQLPRTAGQLPRTAGPLPGLPATA